MIRELEAKALDLRRTIVKMSCIANTGHITSACSCLDILVSLYFGGSKGIGIMRYRANEPLWDERDYFVLSKGHAGIGQYAVLAKAGYIREEELWTFCAVGSRLGAHPTTSIPGVETASGSLGHGLPFAVGLALSAKLKNTDQTIYCITGDGELQEGTNWEAAMSIAHFNLNNLVWIIDKNELQLGGPTEEIMTLSDLRAKVTAFGFDVEEIDGHSFIEMENALEKRTNKPRVVIAHTIKGGGIPSIAGKRDWHNKRPSEDELAVILSELGMTKEDLKVEKSI
jgi:transketolase